jgi:hypothetical protein
MTMNAVSFLETVSLLNIATTVIGDD